MNKYLLNAIGVAILALVATSTWAVWEWGGVGQTTKTSLPTLVQKMDTILDRVGEPKNGTVAEIDKLILGAKSLVVHADLVANHEQKQLSDWDARGTTLFTNVNGAVADLRGTVRASTKTVEEAQKVIESVGTMPPHVNDLTDQIRTSLYPLPDTLRGLTGTSQEVTAYIHGPMTNLTDNLSKLANTTNTTESHIDQRFFAPWDGKHPFRHYAGAAFGTGLQLGNLGATLVRDTK